MLKTNKMTIYVKRMIIQLKNMTMIKFFLKDFCIKLNEEK